MVIALRYRISVKCRPVRSTRDHSSAVAAKSLSRRQRRRLSGFVVLSDPRTTPTRAATLSVPHLEPTGETLVRPKPLGPDGTILLVMLRPAVSELNFGAPEPVGGRWVL